jgi:pimeloyl-ACP methyl ester carboxylesterase
MTTFVLVHGAFHGGWCWEKVVPLVEKRGHRAIALDLPGHGSNQAPIEVLTLDSYVSYVLGVVDSQAEPVVLVGHSLGGLTIGTVAERRPERIRKLVYLCAAMLRPGEVWLDVAANDADSLTRRHQQVSPDGVYSTVPREQLKPIFYGDCSDADVQRAADRLVPQSMAMRKTPLPTSEARWGKVPRLYVHCLRDRAISIAQQRRLVAAAPCPTVDIDTDHSPFYSAPERLAEVLAAA